MRIIHGLMKGILIGAFIGLFLGEGVGVFLRRTFDLDLGAVGCPSALVGIMIGILSPFVRPIHVFFNYISVLFLAIFSVWLFGRIGFASGEYLGTLVLGDIGHRVGGVAGQIVGVIFAIVLAIINGAILTGRTRIPIDEV